MTLVNRKKRIGAELAEVTRSANLFKEDDVKLMQHCQRRKIKPADGIRQLVSEAFIQRELGERESDAGNGIDHRAVGELLDEHMGPIRQELSDIKECQRSLASMVGDLQNLRPNAPIEVQTQSNGVLSAIDAHLNEIYEKISVSFTTFRNVDKLLEENQERADARAQAWHQATYALIANIFSWNWTIFDWLKRYVVIPQVALIEPSENVALAVEAEIKAPSCEARKRRSNIERKYKLPKDEKREFLSNPQ